MGYQKAALYHLKMHKKHHFGGQNILTGGTLSTSFLAKLKVKFPYENKLLGHFQIFCKKLKCNYWAYFGSHFT